MSSCTQNPAATILTDIEDLKPIVGHWRRLLENTADASYFQTPGWLEAALGHNPNHRQLRFVLIGPPESPMGLVPLVLQTRKHRVGRIRVLAYPLDNWGTWYGPMTDSPQSTLTVALQRLARDCTDWDLIELDWLRAGSATEATTAAFAAAGLSCELVQRDEVSLIELAPDWQTYWMTRTSKWRNNVRRNEKRAALRGRLKFVHYRPTVTGTASPDPRWDLYDLCLSVAQESWQGTSQTGTTLTHTQVQKFLRDVHLTATEEGAVSIHLMLIDDQPAAFAYNYVWQGSVFGLRSGFDPRFAECGPGSVLLARVIEDCFQRHDKVFDLGESPAEYKRFWRSRLVPRFRARYYRPSSPIAQTLRLAHSLRLWMGRASWKT